MAFERRVGRRFVQAAARACGGRRRKRSLGACKAHGGGRRALPHRFAAYRASRRNTKAQSQPRAHARRRLVGLRRFPQPHCPHQNNQPRKLGKQDSVASRSRCVQVCPSRNVRLHNLPAALQRTALARNRACPERENRNAYSAQNRETHSLLRFVDNAGRVRFQNFKRIRRNALPRTRRSHDKPRIFGERKGRTENRRAYRLPRPFRVRLRLRLQRPQRRTSEKHPRTVLQTNQKSPPEPAYCHTRQNHKRRTRTR